MRFLNGYGFLLSSHYPLGIRFTGCWEIPHFSTPLFSTDFDTGHGIKCVSSMRILSYEILFKVHTKKAVHHNVSCNFLSNGLVQVLRSILPIKSLTNEVVVTELDSSVLPSPAPRFERKTMNRSARTPRADRVPLIYPPIVTHSP